MSVQDQKPKWAHYFSVDDTTWAKLCAEATKNHSSPLEVALEMSLINQENLLKWDRDTSKIPVLKIDFFNSEPPLALFQKFDYIKCRLKGCMPVTEWNGNIYWTKLSSDPTGFEAENSKPFWFLAPWAGVKKWFAAWKATTPLSPQEFSPISGFIDAPSEGSPEEVSIDNNFNFGVFENKDETQFHQRSQSKSFTGTEMRILSEPESQSQDLAQTQGSKIELEKPSETLMTQTYEPIVLEPMPASTPAAAAPPPAPLRPMASEQAVSFLPPEAPPPPMAMVPVAQDTGPIAMVHEKVSVAEAPIGLTNLSNEVTAAIDFSSLLNDAPQGAVITPVLTAPIIVPAAVTPKTAPLLPRLQGEVDSMPPLPDEATEHVTSAGPTTSVGPIEPEPTIVPLVKPPPQPVATDDPSLKTKTILTIPVDQYESRIRLATSQDSLAEAFMGSWQNYFEQVMILLFINGHLTIWWDNRKFKNQFVRGETIPFEGASVFKIVNDSGHSYHGHASPCTINDRFFKYTNAGQYPDHLTIVPVKSGEHVVAMLLGMCSKEASKKIVLSRLEEDSKLFANSFSRLGLSKKAS